MKYWGVWIPSLTIRNVQADSGEFQVRFPVKEKILSQKFRIFRSPFCFILHFVCLRKMRKILLFTRHFASIGFAKKMMLKFCEKNNVKISRKLRNAKISRKRKGRKRRKFCDKYRIKKFLRNSQDYIINFTEFTAPSSACAFCRSYCGRI